MSLQHSTRAHPDRPGTDRREDLLGSLAVWLKDLAQRFRSGERPDIILGPFGAHVVRYGDNDEDGYGPYAVVGFCLTEAYDMGWFSEIDDGTYGRLMGFRIYLDDIVGA